MLTTGSIWWGVGGNSGSGGGATTGSTPVLRGDRCRARPTKGLLNTSSSFSGAGGGNGLGWGRLGERRAGCPPRVVPPALLTGDRDRELSSLSPVLSGGLWAVVAASAGWAAEDDAPPFPSECCSGCAGGAFELSAASSASGESGCDAGSSSARVDAVWRADAVDLVGDSGVGCSCVGCCDGGGSGGVVDSTGTEEVGDVLRLLGADDSITGQLW